MIKFRNCLGGNMKGIALKNIFTHHIIEELVASDHLHEQLITILIF